MRQILVGGGSKEKRKAHWIGWSKTCRSKSRGGLGFRDLAIFNKAMLAKLSWRILKSPESLMAKVLKGKYYSGESFLKAKEGCKASIVWKNILWGRSLFEKGYKWKVGNEKQVYIDQDPLITNEGSWIPLGVKDHLKGRRVVDIIKEDGSWKEDIIREAFLPSDAEAILDMPRRPVSKNDEIILGKDSKGLFSVKGAYHLACHLDSKVEASGSDSAASQRFWNSIWNIDVRPKVKITVWRAINNALPTFENIKK